MFCCTVVKSLVDFFNKPPQTVPGQKIINPSGGYPADIHRMSEW